MRIYSDTVNDFRVGIGAGTYALDTVLVDEYGSACWFVDFLIPSNGSRMFIQIMATHNGRAGADATTGVYAEVRRVRTASVAESNQLTISVVLVGSGASQAMELRVVSSSANWASANVHRMGFRGQDG